MPSSHISSLANGDQLCKLASITAIASILYGLYSVTYKSKQKNASKEIPSPERAIPYFGHIFHLDKQIPALQFHEWHKKYGPIFQIKMGVQSWVVISDRYIAHEILGIKGSVTGGRLPLVFSSKYHSPSHSGIGFINPNHIWKRNRTLVQSIISPKGVAMSASMIESEVDRTAEMLLNYSKEESGVHTIKYMQFMLLNVILKICFGIHADSIDDPLVKSMVYMIDGGIKFSDLREDIGAFLPFFAPVIDIITRKEKAMKDFIDNGRDPLYCQLIDEASKRDIDCFAKNLCDAMEAGSEINKEDILVLCTELIGAGVDTTAMTLAWGFVILCHHKELQERLQSEIDAFIGKHNRLPVYEEREHFPLLLSVQKECMRYKPPVHINIPHVALKDLNYKGYLIRKGTVLLGNIYSLCRSPDIYDDPEEFKPERYLGDMRSLSTAIKGAVDSREHYVFGWGRRICPGVDLADVVLFNVWIRILATAVIEPPLNKNGEPLYPNIDALYDAGLVIGPRESNLRFVKRVDCAI